MPTELTRIADELYGLTPGDFTAARNRRAQEAGDEELRGRIRQLVKPSVPAWTLNALARERPHDIDRVVEVGEAMLAAQARFDRDELTELAGRRRQLLREVASHAEELARKRGQKLSASAASEIETTLQSATVDRGVADALRSGRLLRALSATGVEPVDVSSAVAVWTGGRRAPKGGNPKRDRATTKGQPTKRRDVEEKRARAAKDEAERAARELRSSQKRLEDLRAARDRLADERDELSDRLERTDGAIAEADRELSKLSRELPALTRTTERLTRAANRMRHDPE